ncbi:MAG TPA: rod shape-determining protein MreD [Abditibacteriaceae bacterium]|jgi:rod shape-determining protein MreD
MWRIAILLWLAFVLQTTWFCQPFNTLGGARVDLPLLVVISVGLLWGARVGLICGLAAGLLSGVITSYNPGSLAISRLIVGGICGTFDRRFSHDNPLAVPLCMAGGTLLAHVLFGLMSPADFAQPWGRFWGTVALNTVFGTLLHLGLLQMGFAPRDEG